jgi:AcrR family transcriptional regulator
MHHFGRKEQLYGEVVGRIAGSLDALSGELPGTPDAGRWLEALVRGYVDWALGHPDDSHLLLRELLDNAERARSASRWYLRSFVQTLLDRIRAGQHDGQLQPGPPALCLEMLFGSVSYHLAARPTHEPVVGRREARRTQAGLRQHLVTAMVRAFVIPDPGGRPPCGDDHAPPE